MALKDIRELKNDPEAYAAELEQRWTGLLSYRYIGRNHGSMNTGAVDNTVTLRRDMRNATGGLLVAPISISSPEGDVGSDLVAVPNPVIHSCQILDAARDVTRIEVIESEVLHAGARMGYSRSKIVDADDHTGSSRSRRGRASRSASCPRDSRRCPRTSSRSSTRPTSRRCGRCSAHRAATTATGRSPELSVEMASPDAALHIGPQHVVLETAAIDAAAELAGTDHAADAVVARDVPRPGQGRTVPGRQRSGARRRRQGRACAWCSTTRATRTAR